MDNILDILYEYSINNKLFEDIAISKILDILLKDNGFDKSIVYEITEAKKFSLDNIFDANILAEFDMDTIIYVHYSEILKAINKRKHLTKFDVNLNKIEIMFKKNIMILETILHEIEHVKQFSLVKDIYAGSLETQLYRYEYDIIFTGSDNGFVNDIKRNIFYIRNYRLSFMERMANINSFENTALMIDNLKNEYQILYDNEIKILDDYMISGYKNVGLKGPTTKFINTMDNLIGLSDSEFFDIASNLCLDERFRYGFTISYDEYKKKIKK